MTDDSSTEEPYLRVEEVAERLGLPLPVLMRRVEAGDIPSRREDEGDAVRYWLRLGDLGIDAPGSDGGGDAASAAPADEGMAHVESAIQSSFNPGEPSGFVDAPWSVDGALPSRWPGMDRDPAPAQAQAQPERRPEPEPEPLSRPQEQPEPQAQPQGEGRPVPPREPQQPPDWLRVPHVMEPGEETSATAAAEHDPAPATVLQPRPEPAPAPSHLPVPQASPRVDLLEPSSPRGDLAVMSLDARELVAGLLDRWERTLEQRIYTEQRQRFEGELSARQNAVKQLQMELHTARAEHAAAQAEKDRLLAEKERELADREREVAEAKRQAIETSRRRRWFRRSDD